ncbi:MAG: GW dipeptide domain-containing protein [Bacteroidota bacterium]
MRLKIIIFILVSILVVSCSNKEEPKKEIPINKNQHKVTVQEVIQVTQYTYLRVTEGEKEYWMASPKANFEVGEVLLYDKAMEMKNFESKELNKTFDLILFIDSASIKLGEGTMNQPQKPIIEKENISIQPVSDGITIAQLYSKADFYSGKIVKVKGKVTKFNSGIMKRNWVHIQDGTSAGENFDLTITTNDFVETGKTIIFEGKISLNKDFGYGYSYKVMMEDAKTLKNI